MSPLTPFGHFSDLTVKLSKVNRAFMNRVEIELQLNKIYEINASQALLLKNIGKSRTNVSKVCSQGYYLGTNISYNLNILLKGGYLTKEIYEEDRRCAYLFLTKKGTNILNIVNDVLIHQQESLTKVGIENNFIENIISILDKLQTSLDNSGRL